LRLFPAYRKHRVFASALWGDKIEGLYEFNPPVNGRKDGSVF